MSTVSDSFETNTPRETEAVGRALGVAAQGGEVLALEGELGTGKTTLVRGLARGLDVPADEPVTSPTFILLSEYEGRLRLLHLDAYRLPDAEAFERLGALPDRAQRESSLVAVEWADQVAAALPQDRLTVRLEHVDPNTRRLEFAADGPISRRWLAAFRVRA